jgi:hypothetical protein
LQQKSSKIFSPQNHCKHWGLLDSSKISEIIRNNLLDKIPPARYSPNMTRDEIQAKMVRGRSFWVETKTERKDALDIARTLRLPYTTSAINTGDPTQGFNVCRVILPKKKGAK